MKSNIEILKTLRRGWGDVNPVTQIVPNKKKYNRKKKHKNRNGEH